MYYEVDPSPLSWLLPRMNQRKERMNWTVHTSSKSLKPNISCHKWNILQKLKLPFLARQGSFVRRLPGETLVFLSSWNKLLDKLPVASLPVTEPRLTGIDWGSIPRQNTKPFSTQRTWERVWHFLIFTSHFRWQHDLTISRTRVQYCQTCVTIRIFTQKTNLRTQT